MTNHKPTTMSRMKQDYLCLKKNPVPYITAEPLPSNLLEWHYVVKGPKDSPYQDGYYHGILLFPREFPFKPPSIYMLTPNGRFKTNTRLCLSISDYHPNTWNPTWSVGTVKLSRIKRKSVLAVFIARRYRNQHDPAYLPARAVFPARGYIY